MAASPPGEDHYVSVPTSYFPCCVDVVWGSDQWSWMRATLHTGAHFFFAGIKTVAWCMIFFNNTLVLCNSRYPQYCKKIKEKSTSPWSSLKFAYHHYRSCISWRNVKKNPKNQAHHLQVFHSLPIFSCYYIFFIRWFRPLSRVWLRPLSMVLSCAVLCSYHWTCCREVGVVSCRVVWLKISLVPWKTSPWAASLI